jgi:hypothetical protein
VHGNFRRRKPLSVTETRKELSQFAAIAGRCAYNRMRPRDGARAMPDDAANLIQNSGGRDLQPPITPPSGSIRRSFSAIIRWR